MCKIPQGAGHAALQALGRYPTRVTHHQPAHSYSDSIKSEYTNTQFTTLSSAVAVVQAVTHNTPDPCGVAAYHHHMQYSVACHLSLH